MASRIQVETCINLELRLETIYFSLSLLCYDAMILMFRNAYSYVGMPTYFSRYAL